MTHIGGSGGDGRRAWERLQGLELYLRVVGRLLAEMDRRGLGSSPQAAALLAARQEVRGRARALARAAERRATGTAEESSRRRALTFWRRPWR